MISFIQPIYASLRLETTNHSALEKPHLCSLSAYLNKFLHTLYAYAVCKHMQIRIFELFFVKAHQEQFPHHYRYVLLSQ